MKELEIKLTGTRNLAETVVEIDDKPVQFKKNQFGSLVCRYQTANDHVNIKVKRLLDVGGLWWFITQLCFFLISILGIFDVRSHEKGLVLDFEAAVDLKTENNLTLRLNRPQADGKAINIETDLGCRELSNGYYLDTHAARTLKRLKFAKICCALATIVIAIGVLMTQI